MLTKAQFMNLNLIQADPEAPMHATVSYRLINTEEQAFIVETLALMGLGVLLIFGSIGILFRVFNASAR
jgi:hypothetical protein